MMIIMLPVITIIMMIYIIIISMNVSIILVTKIAETKEDKSNT